MDVAIHHAMGALAPFAEGLGLRLRTTRTRPALDPASLAAHLRRP